MFINFHGKVLEIENDYEGSKLIVSKKTQSKTQKWTITYETKETKIKTEGLKEDFGLFIGRPFYIISAMSMNRALDIKGGRNVVIRTKKYNEVSQQWIFDNNSKTIKSYKYKDKSLDIQNSGKSSNLQIYTTNSRWW